MNNKAFTLIELLVVVLIIGILAAVALPQYKNAVEKAHATEAITQVRALADVEKAYYLANGEYTDSFEELSVDFPGTSAGTNVINQKYWDLKLTDIKATNTLSARRKGTGIKLRNGRWYIVYDLSTDKLYCGAYPDDVKSTKICKSFGPGQDCPAWGNETVCYPIP